MKSSVSGQSLRAPPNGQADFCYFRAMSQDDARDMIRMRTGQIVLVQDSKGLGTGVVVGPDGWILTNKHVAPSVGPYRVVLATGMNVHGVGVHQSVHHD